MKKSTNSLTLIFASSLAGVALFSLAQAEFTAAFSGDVFFAIVASIAVVGFAIWDYSRRIRPLSQPGQVLRPGLRTGATPGTVAGNRKDRIAA
jgi:hypothetical protein